jgi:hypothetical protein
MSTHELTPPEDKTTRIDPPDEGPRVGEWYWVKEIGRTRIDDDMGEEIKEDDTEWLGCVTTVGSNYAELTHPNGDHERIHLDKLQGKTRREPDPKSVIEGRVADYRSRVQKLLGEVKSLTASLGLTVRAELAVDKESTALATLSGAPDVKVYETALTTAKKETLPKLFKEIEKANKGLAMWLKAETLPLKAAAESMKGSIKEIEGRIFNVSLYAGLTEQVKLCRKGKPADPDEKLRVLQRRLYMDEECLLNYRHGGIECKDIRDFDKWLAKRENLERVLPFPRCMVAMRVRREEKERDWGGDPVQLFINIRLKELDDSTFLYIRNGSQLWRMNCDLEFGELIFPPREEVDLSEPLMVKLHGGTIEEFMKKREWDAIHEQEVEQKRLHDEWNEAHPFEEWVKTWNLDDPKRNPEGIFARSGWEEANPHKDPYHFASYFEKWEPFDKSSVHYDDFVEKMAEQVRQWNRIALIIQGLFDRSEVLHPHPPVQSWTRAGFDKAIELIYDGSHALHGGEAPDFEAYRARCNASLRKGSVTIGQDGFWTRREAEKLCERLDRSWRDTGKYRPTEHRPYGNPGPGYVARVVSWSPTKGATFAWTRERQGFKKWSDDSDVLKTTITVPASELFNVSAYKLGDYLAFFRDPRTRAQYLKWAPALLAAEEFYAGNIKLKEPPS